MSDALAALAAACGIADEYHDIWGGHHPTTDSTRRDLLAAMHFPPGRVAHDPVGLLADWRAAERRRAAAPRPALAERCHQPAALQAGKRLWGLTVQLYGVRSRRNWGIGDFTDLGGLLELTAAAGGDLVGLNPLHALFPDNPLHISPYSPSHRGFLNVLYLDVEAVPELADCAPARRRLASTEFRSRLQALRDAEYVDYAGVAAAKFEILPLLFDQFRAAGGARAEAFAAWRAQQGEALERLALFETLQAHWRAADANAWGWPVWPADYRDPAAPAVAAFARENAEAVVYRAWLQWLADGQLAAAAARARELGLAVGIYQDLAVGANPGGAEVWSDQAAFAIGDGDGAAPAGAHAGAPPDDLNLLGQDWGLPPFVPYRLRETGYAPFGAILRANMRHAGALRIDHVMGLARMFWVPADAPATEGAYVHYPFDDMLGAVAAESVRSECLVIGEDLGTVPDGFRERLVDAGVLSYHPLIFERYPDSQFRLPSDMPRQALVAAGTHDLPTLAGFWRGTDLAVRTALMLFPGDAVRQRLIAERDWDRGRLLWALEREGLLPAGTGKDPAALPELTPELIAAIHAYLARSPAQIMVVQPEDVFGIADQTNVPGTLEDRHPNWQRKLPLPLEDWAGNEDFRRVAAAVRAARPA